MPASIFKSGAWHPLNKLSTFKSVAWHNISNGWVFKSGAWHLFFSDVAAFLSAVDVTRTITGGGASNQQIRVDTDGNVYRASSSSPTNDVLLYQWKLGSGPSSDYTVGYTTLAAGTTPSSGSGAGVFNSLSSSRTWANNQAGGGSASKTSTLNVQIRKASDSSVLASTTFKLTAAVEP